MKTFFDENQVLNLVELMQVRGGDGKNTGDPGEVSDDIILPPPPPPPPSGGTQ